MIVLSHFATTATLMLGLVRMNQSQIDIPTFLWNLDRLRASLMWLSSARRRSLFPLFRPVYCVAVVRCYLAAI